MKLGWYLRRLGSMEPAEIVHRVGEAMRKRTSRGRHEGWSRYPAVNLASPFPEWPARILAASPRQRRAIGVAADAILAGEFSALGRAWPRRETAGLFPAGLWRLDPVTGGAWPDDAYCFDIDVRGGADRGDIKYAWEINRLQFLPVLAARALLDAHQPSLEAIDAAIDSWYRANPPFRGIGWASGIEVALRAISLIATVSIVGERLGNDTRKHIGSILAASAFWLPRFPSRYSSANNHLVAELAGEYLIARTLGRDASSAARALARQVELQILPDGCPAEQSPTYGAFTAELALICADAARQAGAPFPAIVDKRLAAFAAFVNWLGPTSYGDDDEGRVLTLGGELDYTASVARAVGGAAAPPVQDQGGFRELILGSAPQVVNAPSGLRTFAKGGLSIWRGVSAGRTVGISFDHGPLGYLSIAAHGHADALAFTLTVDGLPVLVDPGTYLYGSGGAWRDWFRSTPAHNTLNIAGESQSIMAGAFNWSRKATVQMLEAQREPDWLLQARHDGYSRRFDAVHERTLSREGEEIVVADRLLGRAQECEIVFQLAPGLRLAREGSRVSVSGADGPLLSMVLPSDTFSISTGTGDDRASGWVAPSFGRKVPALRLAWRGVVGDAGVVTRVCVRRGPDEENARGMDDGAGSRI